MARHLRDSTLENRSGRLALKPHRRPQLFTAIASGVTLGYRRNHQAPGTWVVKVAKGNGQCWTKVIGIADDFETADGVRVLTFFQAQEQGRKVSRGSDADSASPESVSVALDRYADALKTRGSSKHNVSRLRGHLTPALLAKPVSLLTFDDLRGWRDLLLAKMKAATALRICKVAKAALNLAAQRDRARITNQSAWKDGLSFDQVATRHNTRNHQALEPAEIATLVAGAYAEGAAFGLYVEVLAVTGARPSQVARLQIDDLKDDGRPRLMMPKSGKGRNGGAKKNERDAVPITADLAAKLRTAAGKRARQEFLLLRSDGRRWQDSDDGDHEKAFARTAERAGLAVTIYALRHSSITRSLKANKQSIKLIADLHSTSVAMIEKFYASHIVHHADALARDGLLVFGGDNVTPLPRAA